MVSSAFVPVIWDGRGTTGSGGTSSSCMTSNSRRFSARSASSRSPRFRFLSWWSETICVRRDVPGFASCLLRMCWLNARCDPNFWLQPSLKQLQLDIGREMISAGIGSGRSA